MSANETLMRVCDAALFDLDGVLTPTAEVHMHAWARMFNEYLTARGFVWLADTEDDPADTRPYTDADYFAHVDGKPRYDGVRDFLASRGIELPWGDPSDPAGGRDGLRPRQPQERELRSRPRQRRRHALPGLGAAAGLPRDTRALQSPSSPPPQNADAVLTAAGLRDRFEVVVDGRLAHAEGLPGKPAPDTYLRAAVALGVPKERAVVFEDAVSGTEAGRAGGFGLVVGVDRGVGAQTLLDSGADLVVSDLAELLP